MTRRPMTPAEADDLTKRVSLDRRIACVRRELAMRESAYPKWVAQGRMKQAEADDEIQAMRAVLATLELLAVAVSETLARMGSPTPPAGDGLPVIEKPTNGAT